MKQTLEKRLIVDISSKGEMIEGNEIEVTWIEKKRHISDFFTKAGVPSTEILNVLSTSKAINL